MLTNLHIKNLIAAEMEKNTDIENSLFNSIHSVCIETLPGYKAKGEYHLFTEDYDDTAG